MKNLIKLILLISTVCGIGFVLYTKSKGLHIKLCAGGEIYGYCKAVLYTNIASMSLMALATILYVFSVLFKRGFIRFTIVTAIFIALTYCAQMYSLSEIKEVQTYGFELFIASFYFWLASLFTFFISALLFPKKVMSNIISAMMLTIFAAVLFAFSGRGGHEHVSPLVGGFFAEQSIDSLKIGVLYWLLPAFFAVGFIYMFATALVGIIKDLDFKPEEWLRITGITVCYFIIGVIPVLSISAGKILNDMDIKEAKLFIEKMQPKLREYYMENQEYPKMLAEVFPEAGEPPRLIDRYQYLAEGLYGSYYFSRPNKYCFIFQDPASDYGFYSLTSDRGWKFYNEKSSLEESYISMCDENKSGSSESLIAGHLGLVDPDDPLSEYNVRTGTVYRPAMTSDSSEKLDQVIKEYGKKDPSIYGEKSKIPETKEGLRFMLQYAPVGED